MDRSATAISKPMQDGQGVEKKWNVPINGLLIDTLTYYFEIASIA